MPKVSFVMPTFNNLAWIGEALQSLLTQSEKDIEIIIINDASTDGTTEWLKEYEANALSPLFPYDDRVKVIHNETNLGAGRSRNIGTEAAGAPLIGICDADDWYITDRAALIVKHFELNKDSELVTFPYVNVGYYNETLENFDGEPFDYEAFQKGTTFYFSNPSAAARKSALLEVGGYEKEELQEKREGERNKTDDRLFLEKWIKAGKKIDFQPGIYVTGHRNLPTSMMTKIRGWKPEWASNQ
jgi:glycosyltransferase involved in cell wall biosynthesis